MSEELEEEKTSWDTQPRRHSLCPQVPGVIRRLETCRDRGILDEVQCVRSARGAAVQVMDRLNKRCRKEAVRLCVHDSPVGTSRATVGRGTVLFRRGTEESGQTPLDRSQCVANQAKC